MAKTVRRNTSITSVRGNTLHPEVVDNFVNFRFNHLPQRTVRPTKLGCADGWTTPNGNGGPAGPTIGGELGTGNMVNPPNTPGATKV